MSLAPGTRLAPYEILALIGAGGMGEVYKARDTRLDRIVAIKQLKGQHSARFQQEARAIAALNHPNICTLHDIGPDYLVMEYVEGKPLRGPLRVEEVVRLALQIAGALEEAHGSGILHRDLKPGNILVTGKSVAKLLDFGLAKLMTDSNTDSTETIEGTVLGTAAYMAPEQAEGKPLDERSDVFSFGAVLYEMLSGNRAFSGNSTAEVISAVLRDDPSPIQAPVELQRIVKKCLAKQPKDRFPNMGELRGALEQISAKAAGEQPSIAVLPFANLSADKENEYFSDGLAEDILNLLAKIPGLKVIARTSAFAFRGKEQDIRKIAETLGVANVLEGSVRRAGNRLRITAQLINAADGTHLWSERYDRDMTDVFAIQDEIGQAISEALKVRLAPRAQAMNVEAYELYLKGRHSWHQRSPATLRVAIQCFEQTIKLDPQYALAYAGLADCYGIFRVYGWMSADDARAPAHAAITQALTLAPSLWEVNLSRGLYAFYLERTWREAGPYFQKAIAINPRSSLAQQYYGLFLATEGRSEDAVTHATLACQLDPLSAFIHAAVSVTLYILGRFDAAERSAQQALELQSDQLVGLWIHGLALCCLGRNQEAIEALDRAATLSRTPMFVGLLGLGYARARRLDDATRLLRELEERASRGEYVAAFAPLAIHVGLADLPAIRRTLSKMLEETTPPTMLRTTSGPFLEAFRSDPEIDRMLSELYG
jgi:TolB-like protein/tRNA A-37 threonylcarbamoyl transferase component Bud32/Flp pilus assembly protein TadD